ncbi:MAG TPA: PIN domain-containing protein [Tepidisphaeraceae bacterium]|nr:PIN domain-containing protein [Tepidisphaeraceae bacterium]
MTRVFIDTVGLLALWDKNDQWYAAAEPAWRKMIGSGAVPCTTPFVLLECGNAASRRSYRQAVDDIRQQFERAEMLIWPTDDEWVRAWDAYDRGKPGAAGIVDQFSFMIMRRLGITDAFTNDRHFRAVGFTDRCAMKFNL